MYTITHGNRTLFDPTQAQYTLEAPILSLEANKLASLEFTIYPNNPEYDLIAEHTSVFNIYRDGTLMIRLRPVYKKRTFAGGTSWRCEDLAARLDDILHRPDYFEGTVENYITRLVGQYNARVGSANAIHLGRILHKPNEEDVFINDDYEGFWEALNSHIVDVYGGYMIPRHTANGLYIDYLSDDDLPVGTQTIRFGENMADMFLETESDEMYSVLIPLGADKDVENPQDGQANQRPMDISSVNGGNDYINNAAAVQKYGIREKTQRWQAIDNATELKTKGTEYLTEHAAKLKDTITLTAIDLHNLDLNVAALQWMTRIPIESDIHDVHTQYTATKLDLHLGTPEPIQLQMGEPKEVFTDRAPKNSISKRRTGGGGGGGGGRAASQEDMDHWQMIVRKENDILWNSGIKEIYESGIILDAESGVRLYNIKDIMVGNGQVVGLKGYIDVNASHIDTVVEKTGINDLGDQETLTGRISVEAGRISQIVTAVGANGEVTAASIVLAINNAGSSVRISADKIVLDGVTIASKIEALEGHFTNLTTGVTEAVVLKTTGLAVTGGGLTVGKSLASWQSVEVVKELSITDASVALSSGHYFLTTSSTTDRTPSGSDYGYLVTSRTNGSHSFKTETLHYLGYTDKPSS